MSKRLSVVLGGVRAGKSSYAQQLAQAGERVLFAATAEALDDDMSRRIRAHQEARPSEWDTLEEPLDIVGSLAARLRRYDTVLLDCLTLWVSNLMLAETVTDIPAEARRLLDLYQAGDASWIVVSNEVGLGIIAPTRLGPRLCGRTRPGQSDSRGCGRRGVLHGCRVAAQSQVACRPLAQLTLLHGSPR